MQDKKSKQMEELCDRFEEAWANGESPSIEAYLERWPSDDKADLVRELLIAEWEQRRANGEHYTAEEYSARFPEHSKFISVAVADELGTSIATSGAAAQRWNSHAPDPSAIDGVLRIKGSLKLNRLHAAGGLGEVFVAFDQQLQREVAVKRIKSTQLDRLDSTRRFQLEAEITGRLEHPGIVPVHGVGYDAGDCPFYVMKLIRGSTLQDQIESFYAKESEPAARQNELEFRQLLNHFVAACNALDYAHSKNVIHRDVKPKNIMVGKYGETQLVDWGLARVLDQPDDLKDTRALKPEAGSGTLAGQALGTPAFMSPEQADGALDLIDQRSDVYGLGATLYVLLTGSKPFDGDVSTVLANVAMGRFRRPRQIRSTVPMALEAVCLKCMSTQPAQRYPNAGEVARDIESYLGDQPVTAWDEPFHVRIQRFLRKQQKLLLVSVMLMIIATTILVANAYRRERSAHHLTVRVSGIFENLYKGLLVDDKPTFLLGVDYETSDRIVSAENISGELKDKPEIQASIMDTIGEHLVMTGELRTGEQYLVPALDLRKSKPADRIALSSSLHHVAFLRWLQGRIPEATQLIEQAIAIRRQEFGGSDDKTLASKILYLVLMLDFPERQDNRIIVSIAKRQIDTWNSILNSKLASSPEAPDIAGIYIVLALNEVYLASRGDTNRFQTSVDLLARAKSHFEQSGIKHTPWQLLSKVVDNRLASSVPIRLSTKSPEQIMDEAIELSKRTFHANEAHPANLMIQLYLVLQMGDTERAIVELRRILEQASPVFDGEPRIASFQLQLAVTLFNVGLQSEDPQLRQRYWTEAEGLLQDAIEVWTNKIGAGHWMVGTTLKILGRIQRDGGNLARAADYFEAAIDIFDKASIEGYRVARQARVELANILKSQGKVADAEQLRRRVRAIRRQHIARVPEILDRLFAPVAD